MKHILYYISSHGFGHGVRSCAVINALPPSVRITIRSNLPAAFFSEEVRRQFELLPEVFDCGCVQIDGVTVDIEKTLATYRDIALRNRTLLAADVAWCHDNGVSLIVTDAAPFPCEVAHGASIPSVVISNFSWVDIYAPYLERFSAYQPELDEMCRQYLLATLLLALEPSNAMSCCTNRISVPYIGRGGINRSAEIKQVLSIDPDHKLCLIYTGNYGMDSVDWKRLESFDGWSFLGVYPLQGKPANFHCISKSDFSFPDLSASADCVVSKLGYGIVTECFKNGVPLIYPPREDFAEYPVLAAAVEQWGGGIRVSMDAFNTLSIGQSLQTISSQNRPDPVCCDGAQRAASNILTLLH